MNYKALLLTGFVGYAVQAGTSEVMHPLSTEATAKQEEALAAKESHYDEEETFRRYPSLEKEKPFFSVRDNPENPYDLSSNTAPKTETAPLAVKVKVIATPAEAPTAATVTTPPAATPAVTPAPEAAKPSLEQNQQLSRWSRCKNQASQFGNYCGTRTIRFGNWLGSSNITNGVVAYAAAIGAGTLEANLTQQTYARTERKQSFQTLRPRTVGVSLGTAAAVAMLLKVGQEKFIVNAARTILYAGIPTLATATVLSFREF
jgi:hypothetical protein